MEKISTELHRIALPLLLSTVVCASLGMIDQAFIGHYSLYAYAGIGLVSSCFYSLTGVLGAIAIIYTITNSKTDKDNVAQLSQDFTAYVIFAFILGLVCCLTLLITTKSILYNFFDLQGQTFTEAVSYMQIFCCSLPLNLVIFICSSTFKIFHRTSYILLTSILVSLINIFLDYILIFGHYGFPSLGSQGAALGSIIALIVNVLIYFYLLKTKLHLFFSPQQLRIKLKNIFFLALPFWGQEITEDIIFLLILNAQVARLGPIALGAFSLLSQVSNVIQLPMFAYTAAYTTMAAHHINIANFSKPVQLIKVVSKIMVVYYFIFFFVLCYQQEKIINFITDDIRLMATTSSYFILALGIQIFNYIYSLLKATIQAMEHATWLLKLVFIVNLCTLILIHVFGKDLMIIYLLLGGNFICNCLGMIIHIRH